MSNKFLTLGVVLAIVIAGAAYLHAGSTTLFGAASPTDVQSTNFTQVTANALTVNTSNTATSTAAFGCIQGYATSTATAVHFELSTTTALATYTGGAAITASTGGTVAWRYGACPV